MASKCALALIASLLLPTALAQHYSATYLPDNAPPKSEQGQTGTNQCGTTSSQSSTCQNAYVNSVEDFCLFAPPTPGPGSTIGETERIEVSWCMKDGHGTRLIPAGAIKGAHFVQTPDYVQITGVGDLTLLNIPAGDAGGELDPHGADGNGNPVGGLVFSTFGGGSVQQAHEWTNFMGADEFCFRACKDGPKAPALCQHIYDVMGCDWNMPANYDAGTFEDCVGDDALPMGIYGSSTFHQGDAVTPDAHPIPSSSQCKASGSIGGGNAPATTTSTTSGGSSTSTTTTVSSSGTVTTSGSVSSTSQTTSNSTTNTSSGTTTSGTSTKTASTTGTTTSKTSGGPTAPTTSQTSAASHLVLSNGNSFIALTVFLLSFF